MVFPQQHLHGASTLRSVFSVFSLRLTTGCPACLQLQDLLEQYGPFKRFEPLQASIQYFAAKTLQPEHLEWAFDLCKRNMEQLYATAWGWNDKIKRKELTHPEARFLLVFQQQQPVAFVHLR